MTDDRWTGNAELWQAWADGYLAAKDGRDETTNPFMVACPTCGGYGMVMDWGGASDCPNDCWHGMVPKSTANIGDTAPIALDKIRGSLLQFRADNPKARHLPIVHNLVNELQAILDNATEPRHD